MFKGSIPIHPPESAQKSFFSHLDAFLGRNLKKKWSIFKPKTFPIISQNFVKIQDPEIFNKKSKLLMEHRQKSTDWLFIMIIIITAAIQKQMKRVKAVFLFSSPHFRPFFYSTIAEKNDFRKVAFSTTFTESWVSQNQFYFILMFSVICRIHNSNTTMPHPSSSQALLFLAAMASLLPLVFQQTL